ncbi:General substrate transporter [Niveomyces insectorum RCEF 264]|uniref:General substrate transporter n=1 Tax=Niveomyces insectorum RCEF 264 TaxID=1081102 RepID=A0A167XNI2_9HYPO|nr:General substrate transporter [Niveomyces insectorum RCEF 264]
MKSLKLSGLPFFRHFTVVSFISVLLLNLSVLEFGFDGSMMGLVQAMDSFDKDFHMYYGTSHHKLDPVKLSILSSIGTPFRAAMILVALFIGERYGRWTLFVVMQLGSLAGATVLYTSRTFVQIVVGRVLLTSFSGWHDWLIPMYLAEIVPGPVRGTVIAFYMIFSYLGSFLASVATFLCSHHFPDARQYRVPFSLMWVAPAICLLFCWVLPESPRWLVRKGRDDKAVRALFRLNGSKNGYSPDEEARLLRQSIEEDSVTQGSWKDLFRGTNKRRTVTVLMCIFLIQLTGQAFVTKYGTIFVKGMNVMDPMEFGLLERGLGIVGPLTLMFIVDRLGRRQIYMTGAILYAGGLYIIGGVGTMEMHRVGNVIIAMYIICAILHIIAYHGVCMIASAEIPHLRLRDKTLTLSYFSSFLCEFGVSFSLPYLLYAPYANLESKVGFIYGSIAFAGVVWGYFYLPDTSKRSLEELEELWQSGIAAYKFSSYKAHGGVGLRVSQLERHAGGGDASSSSEEDLRRMDSEGDNLKRVEVVHEEVVVPTKE